MEGKRAQDLEGSALGVLSAFAGVSPAAGLYLFLCFRFGIKHA